MRRWIWIVALLPGGSSLGQDQIPISETIEEVDTRLSKFPFTRSDLKTMLIQYRRYGLPLPESGSNLIRIPYLIWNNKKLTRERGNDGLAFLPKRRIAAGEAAILWGTNLVSQIDLERNVYEFKGWETQSYDDPELAAPRRSVGTFRSGDNPFVAQWTLLIQLESLGQTKLALSMFPKWYTEMSIHTRGWSDHWADPTRCVAEIGINFAIREWNSPNGDRRRALNVMTLALGDQGFAWNGENAEAEPQGRIMRSALSWSSSDKESPEAAVVGLVEAPRFAGRLQDCPAVKRIVNLGERAIPALLARRKDETKTRIVIAEPFNTPLNVGEIAAEILKLLPAAQVTAASSDTEAEMEYCLKHLLPTPDGRMGFPDPILLSIFAERHPTRLYRASIEAMTTRPDIDPESFFEALRKAEFSLMEHARFLLEQVRSQKKSSRERSLRRTRFDPADTLAALLAITKDETIWKLVEEHIANLPLELRVRLLTDARNYNASRLTLARPLLNDRTKVPSEVLADLFSYIPEVLDPKLATVQNIAAIMYGIAKSETVNRLSKEWNQADWDKYRNDLLQKTGFEPCRATRL